MHDHRGRFGALRLGIAQLGQLVRDEMGILAELDPAGLALVIGDDGKGLALGAGRCDWNRVTLVFSPSAQADRPSTRRPAMAAFAMREK
jgi:hypothetical protein